MLPATNRFRGALALGAVLALALLAGARPASAAIASLELEDDGFFAALLVDGQGAARDKLAVKFDDRGRTAIVRNNSGPIRPRGGCDYTGDRRRRVHCRMGSAPVIAEFHGTKLRLRFLFVLINGSAGRDRLGLTGLAQYRATLPVAFLQGGPGDDHVVGGRMDESVFDGPGDDWIQTGGGVDEVVAAPGFDGNDRIQGGRDFDVVNYFVRTEPVNVDLAADVATTGPDETDILQDIRGAIGGRGADMLRGGGASNLLVGAGGADSLISGGGADFVDGEGGLDQPFAGPGPDLVFGFDQRAETIDCGPGRDVVAPDDEDVLIGCERVIELGEFDSSLRDKLRLPRRFVAGARKRLPRPWARALAARARVAR